MAAGQGDEGDIKNKSSRSHRQVGPARLVEMRVEGIATNLPLHRRLVRDAAFVEGGIDIHHLEQEQIHDRAFRLSAPI